MSKKVIICSRDAHLKKRLDSLRKRTIPNLHYLNAHHPALVVVDEHYFHNNTHHNKKEFQEQVLILYVRSYNYKTSKKIVKKYGFFDYFTEKTTKAELIALIAKAHVVLDLKKKNAKLLKYVEDSARIDSDTGFYRAHYFMESLAHEMERARRNRYPLSFVMCDIDFLRQINESYSYQFGDAIIKEISKMIGGITPKNAFIARWRGGVFIITLPNLGKRKAFRLAKKIKEKVYAKYFCYQKVCRTRVSLSIGIMTYPSNSIVQARGIITCLEESVGFSKKAGGNTISQYTPDIKEKIEAIDSERDIPTLKKKVRYLNKIINQELIDMIYGFAKTIEAKDHSTARHTENTAAIAKSIAQELGLPTQEIVDAYHAAILHDLGKVGINEGILLKASALSKEERETIKTHPWIATEILREIHALRGAVPAILYHHEKWNGTGYPFGLKGEEIPILARIIAIADVYEALISDRPYRKAYSKKRALAMIKKEKGISFDPTIVDLFIKLVKKI